jgi:hypothetical protein
MGSVDRMEARSPQPADTTPRQAGGSLPAAPVPVLRGFHLLQVV